jgi:polysaccharide pyruvyl transferase WcaK-like protein
MFDGDKVVPDLAFSLALPPASRQVRGHTRRIVGINPLPLYTSYWHESDDNKYTSYVGKLAEFADWLVDRGCEVRFIPTQLRVDPGVIQDVMGRMTVAGSSVGQERVSAPRVVTLGDLMVEIAGLDVMVATRYHGIVLSLLQQKAVLSIAYHQKSRDVMTWLGLGEYAVEGDTFDVAALTTRFESLDAAYASVETSLARQIPEFQQAVQAQYDEIYRIVEGVPAAPREG